MNCVIIVTSSVNAVGGTGYIRNITKVLEFLLDSILDFTKVIAAKCITGFSRLEIAMLKEIGCVFEHVDTTITRFLVGA